MTTRLLQSLLAMLALALVALLSAPTTGRSADQITVTGADEVRGSSLEGNAQLTAALTDVRPRVVLQYANQLRQSLLEAVPSSFASSLNETRPRVVLQYANALRHDLLAPGPAPLQSVFAQVASRVVIQYANQNRHFALAYPGTLVGDTTPPQITDIRTTMLPGDTLIVRWTTDEYADSEIDYGTASGVYTGSASDPLYAKQHQLTLTGLPPDAAIYFRVRSTDQSGNTAQSAEQTHAAEQYVYLPLVLRDW